MSTLIFNGSPRKNGDTAALLKILCEKLDDCEIVNAYDREISPCTDCRYCWQKTGCAINDGWQRADRLLHECDSVVIASPIYFSELTGQLLSVLSRLQQYYCGIKFRSEKYPFHGKKGGLILVGGGDGDPKQAEKTGRALLRHMGCGDIHPTVLCHNTDSVHAEDEPHIREKLNALADFLKENNHTI